MCSPDGHHLRVTHQPCQGLVQRRAHDPVLPSEVQEVLGVRLLKFCRFWRILRSQLIHATTWTPPKNMIRSLKSQSIRKHSVLFCAHEMSRSGKPIGTESRCVVT